MDFKEVNQDLFKLEGTHHLAHCISSDYALGAGIAVAFDRKYSMRKKLLQVGSGKYPDVIQIGKVFNLVTKDKCWQKPTYKDLGVTLGKMRELCDQQGISKLAMPKIGCGLDRLEWVKVQAMIHEVFGDSGIEVVVCYI